MRRFFISTLSFVFAFSLLALVDNDSSADIIGNGSHITDNMQIGTITDIKVRLGKGSQLTISTMYEKTAKTYTLHPLPECYVMTADRGVFKKFKELKNGDLIAAYGWYKDGKWNARRIDILDPNDYLVKRLAADAKAGFYYKHER
tara:strand:- start:12588 stop:13022 length:435 start_codon:yes stop_codon:yes gene_type:complete